MVEITVFLPEGITLNQVMIQLPILFSVLAQLEVRLSALGWKDAADLPARPSSIVVYDNTRISDPLDAVLFWCSRGRHLLIRDKTAITKRAGIPIQEARTDEEIRTLVTQWWSVRT